MRLAIIGCGVGGLTLAKTLLHEHSQADIRLYEAWDEWKTRGGSLNLAQGGKILRYLGLEPALTAASNRPARVQQFSNGKLVGSMDLDGQSNLVMRTDLQKLLVESLPADIIHLKREVKSVVENEHDVTLTFVDGSTETADLVVGADGIHSVVKGEVFSPGDPVYAGFRLLYSCSSVPVRKDPSVVCVNWNEVDGQGWHIMDWTAGQGEHRHDVCLVMCRTDEMISDKWDSTIVKSELEKIAGKIASEHEVLKGAVAHAEMCMDWGVYIQPILPTWVSPGKKVALLGDAAHATAPFIGQGANMAMMDAFCLGRLLARDDISVAEALLKYEEKRKSSAEKIVRTSSSAGSMYTATGVKAMLRNFMLPFLTRMLKAELAEDPTAAQDDDSSYFGWLFKKG